MCVLRSLLRLTLTQYLSSLQWSTNLSEALIRIDSLEFPRRKAPHHPQIHSIRKPFRLVDHGFGMIWWCFSRLKLIKIIPKVSQRVKLLGTTVKPLNGTVDGRNPAPVGIGSLSHLQGFSTIPGGDRRISSINRMTGSTCSAPRCHGDEGFLGHHGCQSHVRQCFDGTTRW